VFSYHFKFAVADPIHATSVSHRRSGPPTVHAAAPIPPSSSVVRSIAWPLNRAAYKGTRSAPCPDIPPRFRRARRHRNPRSQSYGRPPGFIDHVPVPIADGSAYRPRPCSHARLNGREKSHLVSLSNRDIARNLLSAMRPDRPLRFPCATTSRSCPDDEIIPAKARRQNVIATIAVPIGDEDSVHDAFVSLRRSAGASTRPAGSRPAACDRDTPAPPPSPLLTPR